MITSKGGYATNDEPIDETDTGWILPAVNTSEELEQDFVNKSKNQRAKVVSDGSHKKGHSTAGFVTVGKVKSTRDEIELNSRVHGQITLPSTNKKDHSSYRGELGGILAAIVYTNKVCKKHKVSAETCEIGLDNKGAIAAAFGWKRPNPRWSCYDIVSMIRYNIKHSPIKWASRHVKGHQDDAKRFGELDEGG